MSEKKHFTCDVCGHAITEGHQQLYMAEIAISYTVQLDDGSCAGVDGVTDTYHAHNDFSNRCARKIWDVLRNKK